MSINIPSGQHVPVLNLAVLQIHNLEDVQVGSLTLKGGRILCFSLPGWAAIGPLEHEKKIFIISLGIYMLLI